MDNKSMSLTELTHNELRDINGGQSIWYYVGVWEGVYLKTGCNGTLATITTVGLLM